MDAEHWNRLDEKLRLDDRISDLERWKYPAKGHLKMDSIMRNAEFVAYAFGLWKEGAEGQSPGICAALRTEITKGIQKNQIRDSILFFVLDEECEPKLRFVYCAMLREFFHERNLAKNDDRFKPGDDSDGAWREAMQLAEEIEKTLPVGMVR